METFYYSMDAAIDCMDTIPYNPTDAKKTIETIIGTMQLYAFRDEIRNSSYGNSHSFLNVISVDIIKELQDTLGTAYKTHQQFLQAINTIFFKIKDPHTYYTKNSCYGFFAAQPLALGSRMENGEQVIFVQGIYSYSSAFLYKNVSFNDFIGATVKSINGKNALDVVIEHAHTYGYLSKDPSCNFNFMLESAFQQRSLKVFPYPESLYQTYRLVKDGVIFEVVLPWVAISPQNVNFTNGSCSVNRAMRLTHKWKQQNSNHPLGEIMLPPHMREVLQPGFETEQRNIQAPGRSVYIYPVNKDVVALQITDFVPEDEQAFLGTINYLLSSSRDKGIKYLILDVRGNGGGSICLGYQVIHRLVAERRPEGRYDVIHSPLMDDIVQTSTKFEKEGIEVPIFGPSYWSDEDGEVFTNISWYSPGVTHVRGKVPGQYSQKAYHACNYTEVYPHHIFKEIIILSDGTCGSTCAVFTTHLQEVDQVKTITLGGIKKNAKMQYFSFPGGQVMDYEDILYFQEELQMKGPNLISKFPDDAGLRFTLLEIYPWLDEDPTNLPLEFMFLPSDMKLDLWKGNRLSKSELQDLYREIIPMFATD